MTRINASIDPVKLCDQHLLAEHREIVRLRHLVNSKSEVPSSFRLGKGHVLYFKDKLGFVHSRYERLFEECVRRGFDVGYYGVSFLSIPPEFRRKTPKITNDQTNQLIERLLERYPKNCKYYRKPLSLQEYKQKLNNQ